MPVPMLDLKAQYQTVKDTVMARMTGVIERQQFIMGPEIPELEKAIAELSHAKHAIGCASGTDAILLPIKALNLKPGDEVITVSFTFFATAGAIHNAGGTPVFVDIEADTFNISPAAIEAAITPRTKAIVAVDLYGQMAAYEKILPLAAKHGLAVIEDGAQAIGARRKIDGTWRMAGELGTAGTFSFFPSKNLGGYGDGGMITTQDDALAERLKRLRLHGGAKQYHHDEVGFNSRLDTLPGRDSPRQAAVPRGLERGTPEARSPLHGSLQGIHADSHSRDRSGERTHFPPVHGARRAPRRSARRAHREGHRLDDLLSGRAPHAALLRAPPEARPAGDRAGDGRR